MEANRILPAERGVPVAARVREAVKPLLEMPRQTVFDYLGRLGKTWRTFPRRIPSGTRT